MAVGRGFKIATAYVEINADDDAAKKAIRDLPKTVGPDADKAGREVGKRVGKGLSPEMDRQGRDAGGKLAKGIQLSMVRNSPIIAAAVGAALAVGAPALLAGAQALFGGLGILAATQSLQVRSAWSNTWEGIRDDTVAASEPIQRVLISLADNVSQRMETLGPRLGGAFRDAAPLVDEFADGVLDAAENALPGLFRALDRGQPVVEGLSSLLRDTGTGISDMFDAMSEHAPAAGQAFAALGSIMKDLLPTLGVLLGQGVELASIVLPPLARVVGVVADAAEMLGPLLPALALGFAGLKIAQSAAGWVDTLSQKLKDLPGKIGGISAATGGAAAALTLFALGYQEATALGQEWAAQLQEGGDAADEARDKLTNFGSAMEAVQEDSWIAAFGGVATTIGMTTTAMQEGKEANEEYLASLNPAEESANRLKTAEDDLATAILEHGAGSREARAAQQEYADASAENERIQGELEMALDGVTQAMIDQANQAFAAIDSNFAYENAVDQLNGAIEDYNTAVQEHGHASEEALDAQRRMAEQSWATAQAYGRQQADLSGLTEGTAEYDRMIQTETLASLYSLKQSAGPEMAAAIQQQINMLEASGVKLSETQIAAHATADRMRDLGLSVRQVPGQKGVIIDAPTADQKQRIRDLGYTIITLPNKQVIVSADASSAYATLNRFVLTDAVKRIPIIGFLAGSAAADGGNVGEKIRGFPGGGKISGPGTRTSDSILAMSESGPLRVSDDEWVINGRVSAAQGDPKMAALNAGLADIVPHSASGTAAHSTPGVSSGPRELHVHLNGTFGFTSRSELRRAAEAIRDALVEIEREYR